MADSDFARQHMRPSGLPMASSPYASAQWGPVGDATLAIWTGNQAVADALAAAQAAIEAAVAQMQ